MPAPSPPDPFDAQVHTLIVEVGRCADDGLPEKATGGALLCYVSAEDEAGGVRETVALLKEAALCVLEVQALGTLHERRLAGEEITERALGLMRRAYDENAVIVAQMTPFFD